MSASAADALAAAGWTAAGPRLWAHPNYGEARFDTLEAASIQDRRDRAPRPTRAPACSCPRPIVDVSADLGRTCVKCGRRTRG